MRLVPVLLFAVAAALPVLAQAKPGDKATVSVESTMDVEITVRDGSGSGETARLLNLVRRETLEQEVLAAADGVANSVRLKVVSSTLQKSGTDTPLEEKPTVLANQSYTSTRGAGGWVARDAEGNAAPVEGAALGAWNDAAWLLPKDGPKAGAKWDVEAATVAALMSPIGMTEPGGKLSCECQSVDGGKASVVFSGKLTGKAKDESLITITVKAGRLEYDLSKGRLSMLSISGSYESLLSVEDVFRKPNENVEERRKIGEISVKSRKLEVIFSVK